MTDRPAPTILVILPCHNEAGRVGPVVHAIRAVLPAAAIAVIDDASTDATAAEARAAGARVLPLAVNLGYGAALETGYLFAVRHNYDIVLQLDGDGQHIPGELPRLLAPVAAGEADLVIGSRYLGQPGSYQAGIARRAGQRLFAGAVRCLTGRRITDPTSGFQALGRRAVRLYTTGLFPNEYPDADIILTAHLAGLRILEVPTRMQARVGGVSMHGAWSSVYYVCKMTLSMFIALLNRKALRKELAACSSPSTN